jgi:hypothetical protein
MMSMHRRNTIPPRQERATDAPVHETVMPTVAVRDLIARLPLIDGRDQPRDTYATTMSRCLPTRVV